MVKIYCIEDINDLKYVGSTKQKLYNRLSSHRQRKKGNRNNCSSKHLNLEYCVIYTLEECEASQSKERERYWINKLDCVNHYKLNGRKRDLHKDKNLFV